MKAVGEALSLFFVIVICAWIAAIFTATADRKPVMACMPVHYFVSAAGGIYGSFAGRKGEASESYPWQDSVRMWCLKMADHKLNDSGAAVSR